VTNAHVQHHPQSTIAYTNKRAGPVELEPQAILEGVRINKFDHGGRRAAGRGNVPRPVAPGPEFFPRFVRLHHAGATRRWVAVTELPGRGHREGKSACADLDRTPGCMSAFNGAPNRGHGLCRPWVKGRGASSDPRGEALHGGDRGLRSSAKLVHQLPRLRNSAPLPEHAQESWGIPGWARCRRCSKRGGQVLIKNKAGGPAPILPGEAATSGGRRGVYEVCLFGKEEREPDRRRKSQRA